MVASEPVTDRFGPRSTPISTAARTWSGTCAIWTTPPRDQPGRQVVDQVAADREHRAGRPRRERSRVAARACRSSPARSFGDAGLLQRLDQHEQPGDQRQHAPGDIARARSAAARASAAGPAPTVATPARKVGSPSWSAERRGRQQHAGGGRDAERRQPAAGRQRRHLDLGRELLAQLRCAASAAARDRWRGSRATDGARSAAAIAAAAACGCRRSPGSPGSRSAARSSPRWR